MIHSERFVDSWIEEIFVWILVTFFMAIITVNLNSELF